MKPVPFSQRQRRLPEAGRIRIGVKRTTRNGKTAPAAIDTFRFTSQSRPEIDAIAAEYGGDVEPWTEPKAAGEQWQVTTPANEIEVVLPPDPLSCGPVYELWGGKGRERVCDGLVMETLQDGPDGPEPVESECRCARLGRLECKPKMRLSVILPRLRFTGVWRLDTSSIHACDEMPGMVDLLLEQQGRGLVCGILRLERRQSSGGSKKYVVPTLGLSESLEGLVSGRARLGALGPGEAPVVGERPALGAGGSSTEGTSAPSLPSGPAPQGDDEVIEGEVVLSLDEVLAALDDPAREALKLWWKEQGLPKRDVLSPGQESAVVDYVRGMGW